MEKVLMLASFPSMIYQFNIQNIRPFKKKQGMKSSCMLLILKKGVLLL